MKRLFQSLQFHQTEDERERERGRERKREKSTEKESLYSYLHQSTVLINYVIS